MKSLVVALFFFSAMALSSWPQEPIPQMPDEPVPQMPNEPLPQEPGGKSEIDSVQAELDALVSEVESEIAEREAEIEALQADIDRREEQIIRNMAKVLDAAGGSTETSFWNDNSCYTKAPSGTTKLSSFSMMISDTSLQGVVGKLNKMGRDKITEFPTTFPEKQSLLCEVAVAIDRSLALEGKLVSSANVENVSTFLSGSLISPDGFSAFRKIASDGEPVSRLTEWKRIIRLGIVHFDEILEFENAPRIHPSVANYSLTSGGTRVDADDILATTMDYYAAWADRKVGNPGYQFPAFMMFRDDAGSVHLSMIDTENWFHVCGPVGSTTLQARFQAERNMITAAGPGLDSDKRAMLSLADKDPCVQLMVNSTNRSWEFELLDVMTFFNMLNNYPDKMPSYHEFAKSLSDRLARAG